jgi:hypothetical protein
MRGKRITTDAESPIGVRRPMMNKTAYNAQIPAHTRTLADSGSFM